MNMLIHQWDLPSINLLGAIDNGKGQWADGYQVPGDIYHPTTEGHKEFFHAFVPSLFDAIESGIKIPSRISNTYYSIESSNKKGYFEFIPEDTVHSFTFSFDIKTAGKGIIASFIEQVSDNEGFLSINGQGRVSYRSPYGEIINSEMSLTTEGWHRISLTHYYAQGRTLLYVDKQLVGELNEKLIPEIFYLNGKIDAPESTCFKELFFYRSAMNLLEIEGLCDNKMLKSSLELYAPLDGSKNDLDKLVYNYAQSMNRSLTFILDQTTGIENNVRDLNNTSNLEIVPNPVQDQLWLHNIKSEQNYDYKIYSLSGRLLTKGVLVKGENNIYVGNLTPNVYILELGNNIMNENFYARFIKQ